MVMTVVNIKVGGRDYHVACDDGQEEHLRLLADEVDDRIHSLFFNAKTPPSEQMALLMAALMLVDELIESKKETEYFMKNNPDDGGKQAQQMENVMAITLEEIAARIEKIAEDVELR